VENGYLCTRYAAGVAFPLANIDKIFELHGFGRKKLLFLAMKRAKK